jgi:hypothetical protein
LLKAEGGKMLGTEFEKTGNPPPKNDVIVSPTVPSRPLAYARNPAPKAPPAMAVKV